MKVFFSLLISVFLFVSIGAFGCTKPGDWMYDPVPNYYFCMNSDQLYNQCEQNSKWTVVPSGHTVIQGPGFYITPPVLGVPSQTLCAQIYVTYQKFLES